ncbi:MAG: YVTN family beta-propeller protein [Paracoccaceae bacterium]
MNSPIDRPDHGSRLFATSIFPAACAGLLGLSACSGSGDSTAQQDPPVTEPTFELDSISNGFGQQLPHVIFIDDGTVGGVFQELRSVAEVLTLATSQNLVLPPVAFPAIAVLPDNRPGNQFFLAKFTADVDPESECFTACTGTEPCGIDALEVVTFDPSTKEEIVVSARVFVGGYTRNANGDLEQWVKLDAASGELRLTTEEAIGFPGSTAPQLSVAADFVAPNSIMVVMDADGDLSTLETFPNAESIQLRIPQELCSIGGQVLETAVVAATTVGASAEGPSVVMEAGKFVTVPRDGQQAVDPSTEISVRFTEAIQPWTLGALLEPSLSPSTSITQAPNVAPVQHAFTVAPRSAYDLTQWRLIPDQSFNGLNPAGPPIFLELAEVEVQVGSSVLVDLQAVASPGPIDFSFTIDRGPSLVNAPVVPESLVFSRGGSRPGLSVLDLNGFGQGTGNPLTSLPYPLEGQSRFPFDPNVTLNPSVRPLLNPGTTTLDGGSAGVFTLTLDVNRNSVLAGSPILSDASDLQYGVSLDIVFNNGPPPFGCQAGSGDVCVLSGLKTLSPNPALNMQVGFPNLVSFAPHPNPPPLVFPAICPLPSIVGREPTSVDTPATNNLLQSGDPFPDIILGIPPTGLLDGRRSPQPFTGPSFGQTNLSECRPFAIRQQIGQFLYVVDRTRDEIAVLNSNRMLVIERIPVTGATNVALSPNLDLLAVTSMETDSVTLIDVNPASGTFHQVLSQVAVGNGPRGVAFDPLDEDVIVCNELGNTLSIIDAGTLQVRKTVPSLVDAPFDLAVTPRMEGFAFNRGVYLAYVLGRNGEVAVFESGPDGTGGIGYDSTLGVLPFVFQAPRDIVLDMGNLDASVYIAYEGPVNPTTGASGPLGVGAISRLRVESALFGPQVIQPGTQASFRDIAFSVASTLSEANGAISGIPTSLAFDELYNYGEYPAPASAYTAGFPVLQNGKQPIRDLGATNIRPTSRPKFLFAAVPGGDVVDVVQLGLSGFGLLDTNPYDSGTQSIPVPDVRFLRGYFSQ